MLSERPNFLSYFLYSQNSLHFSKFSEITSLYNFGYFASFQNNRSIWEFEKEKLVETCVVCFRNGWIGNFTKIRGILVKCP